MGTVWHHRSAPPPSRLRPTELTTRARAPPRPRTVVTLALAGALVLTACSDDPRAEPDVIPASPVTGLPSASPSPTADRRREPDADAHAGRVRLARGSARDRHRPGPVRRQLPPRGRHRPRARRGRPRRGGHRGARVRLLSARATPPASTSPGGTARTYRHRLPRRGRPRHARRPAAGRRRQRRRGHRDRDVPVAGVGREHDAVAGRPASTPCRGCAPAAAATTGRAPTAASGAEMEDRDGDGADEIYATCDDSPAARRRLAHRDLRVARRRLPRRAHVTEPTGPQPPAADAPGGSSASRLGADGVVTARRRPSTRCWPEE